jgi:hypothetical protein
VVTRLSHGTCPLQHLRKLLETTKGTLIPDMYALLGWKPFLKCPPVDNARNLIDYVLYARFYKVTGCGAPLSVPSSDRAVANMPRILWHSPDG